MGHNAQTPGIRIWLTGAAGFLGWRLLHALSLSGHQVLGFSRRELPAPSSSLQIDLAGGDAPQKLADLIRTDGAPDVVIHAAAKQPGSGTLADFVRANVQTTANLIDALRSQPPRRFIYTSTQSVYNGPRSLPVDEEVPATGVLPYSATKRWGEQASAGLRDRSQVLVLRLPSLYGRGQADSFIDGLARTALRNEPIELFAQGALVRDALHVDDVVRAIVAAVNLPANNGEPYSVINLGCGRAITAFEYAQTLVAALGSRSEVRRIDRPARQNDLYADIEKAKRLLSFAPLSLEESLKHYATELRAG
jgi:nucleoside-diphosphate-sugar epimerase